MKYEELNLEEGQPTVDEAMRYLKMSIECYKKQHVECVLIIHGYGSSGKGGIIHDKARQWLNAQVRNGSIKTVIYGEKFNIFNPIAIELKNKYKELQPLLKVSNNGITVVVL